MADTVDSNALTSTDTRTCGPIDIAFDEQDPKKLETASDDELKIILKKWLYDAAMSLNLPANVNNPEALKTYILQTTRFHSENENVLSRLNALFPEVLEEEYENLFAIIKSYATDNAGSSDSGERYQSVYSSPSAASSKGNVEASGDPVILFNGNFLYNTTDFQISAGGLDFTFERTYSQQSFYAGPMGSKWDHSSNLWMRLSENGTTIHRSTGKLITEIFLKHEFFHYWCPNSASLGIFTEEDNIFTFRSADGMKIVYKPHPSFPNTIYLADQIVDRLGNYCKFNYDEGLLVMLQLNNDARKITFQYDSRGRVITIRDYANRRWQYQYDDFGDLVTVTGPRTEIYKNGLTTRYEYSSAYTNDAIIQHNLISIVDSSGQIYLENEYGSDQNLLSYNRVTRQRQGGGQTLFDYYDIIEDFDYYYEANEKPAYQTVVTERSGQPIRYLFNFLGNMVFREQYIRVNGIPKLAATHYRYNKDGNLIGKLTPLGVVTQYLYGRDYYERRRIVEGSYKDSEQEDLDIKTRLGFNQLLSIVRRSNYYTNGSLRLDTGLWKDIFPDLYESTKDDSIQKFTYDQDFNQCLTASDVRFTESADPDFPENEFYHKHLTRFSYISYGQSEFQSLSSIQSPATIQADGQLLAPTIMKITQIDSKGLPLTIVTPSNLVIRCQYFDAATPLQEGHLKQVLADPDILNMKVGWERDLLGRATRKYSPRYDASRDDRFVQTTQYNELDQITTITSTAPFNNKIHFKYDAVGKLKEEITELTNSDAVAQEEPQMTTSYKYDQEFNLIQKSIFGSNNALAKKNKYIFDSAARLCISISPNGKKTKIFFNEQSLIAKQLDDHGGIASATKKFYDIDGRMIRQINAIGGTDLYKYDVEGRVIESEDPMRNKIFTSYDKKGNIICVRHFAINNSENYSLVKRIGFTYDELGRKIKMHINKFDNPVETTEELSNAFLLEGPGKVLTTSYFYNENNQIIKIIDFSGRELIREYDLIGRLIKVKDASANTIRFNYDQSGNLIRADRTECIRDPDTNEIVSHQYFATAYAYDELDRLMEKTNPLGSKMKFEYESRGLNTKIVDELGRETIKKYDVFGRCVSATTSLQSEGVRIPCTTNYSYNYSDLAIEKTDMLGGLTRFFYDKLDRLVSTELPDKTLEYFNYDKLGNLVAHVGRNGLIKNISRDKMGRPQYLSVDIAGAPQNLEPVGSLFASFAYDWSGRLQSAENEYSRSIFKYNSLGWAIEQSDEYKSGNSLLPFNIHSIRKEYSDSGALLGITYPSGRKLTYERDSLDRVISITQKSSGDQYPGNTMSTEEYEVIRIVYEGLRTKKLYRQNGTTTELSYDAGGRPLEMVHKNGETILLHMQFLCDGVGNVINKLEYSELMQSQKYYVYDSLNRLSGASASLNNEAEIPIDFSSLMPSKVPIPSIIPDIQSQIDLLFVRSPQIVSYKYDLAGNRISVVDSTRPSGDQYIANDLDQYSSVNQVFFSYDLNGNLIEDDRFKYKYNFRNQLGSLTVKSSNQSVNFYHDSFGRKIRTVFNGELREYSYDGFNIIQEYRDDKLHSSNVLDEGLDNLLQSSVREGELYYYQDLLKSVRLTISDRGEQSYYDYDEFGSLLSVDNSEAMNDVLFAGKRVLPGTKIYDFVTRCYNPSTGRFLQRDPKTYINGTNLYTFVGNNPLNAIDPFGTERTETGNPAKTDNVQSSALIGQKAATDNVSTLKPAETNLRGITSSIITSPVTKDVWDALNFNGIGLMLNIFEEASVTNRNLPILYNFLSLGKGGPWAIANDIDGILTGPAKVLPEIFSKSGRWLMSPINAVLAPLGVISNGYSLFESARNIILGQDLPVSIGDTIFNLAGFTSSLMGTSTLIGAGFESATGLAAFGGARIAIAGLSVPIAAILAAAAGGYALGGLYDKKFHYSDRLSDRGTLIRNKVKDWSTGMYGDNLGGDISSWMIGGIATFPLVGEISNPVGTMFLDIELDLTINRRY